jgi:hypothetical protein
MNLIPRTPPSAAAHPLIAQRALDRYAHQPDGRAGTIYDRVDRRRPYDRRQQDRPVLFDMRANKGERRRQRRRAVYDPGRRNWPEPPLGIDVWA